jgi:hypothetical protein
MLTDGCRDTGAVDILYLLKVGEITRRFRGMAKPTSKKTRADPYVVALAYMDGYTVVADEHKILRACDALKVKCMTLPAFIRAEI